MSGPARFQWRGRLVLVRDGQVVLTDRLAAPGTAKLSRLRVKGLRRALEEATSDDPGVDSRGGPVSRERAEEALAAMREEPRRVDADLAGLGL